MLPYPSCFKCSCERQLHCGQYMGKPPPNPCKLILLWINHCTGRSMEWNAVEVALATILREPILRTARAADGNN